MERERRSVLRLGTECRLAVLLARCQPDPPPRWLAHIMFRPFPNWVLVARLDERLEPAHAAIKDYWLVEGGVQAYRFGTLTHRLHDRGHDDDPGPLLDTVLSGMLPR